MNSDTLKLLRECNAGIKMGENALNLAISYTREKDLKETLEESREAHAILGDETHKMLIEVRQSTKPPHAVAELMSDTKMKMTLALNSTNSSIASLVTDGCNMGAKSISHYLNKYPAASLTAKHLAHKIIASEDALRDKLRPYL